jgi:probable rRNA maturation factor
VIIVRKKLPGVDQNSLVHFLNQACRAAGLRRDVNVLITSRRAIRDLNRRFRGKDKATDVLSFPVARGSSDLAGDIAICAELVVANAHAFRHSPAEELKILLLHGILHLAGYDHERDNGRMAQQERRLRYKLRLPSSLIARNSSTVTTRSLPRKNRRTGQDS